jgi:hypothetical protein
MPAFQIEFANQTVVLRAEDAALLAHYEEYFRYYESGGEAESHPASPPPLNLDWQLAISPIHPPATAERIAQTGIVSLWRGDATWWLCAGTTTFEIEPAQGRATGYIGAEALAAPPLLTNTYSLLALLLLLRWRGVYHLHAAAVRSPAGRLYWLCGAQRSGKTTLATALGLAGWQPLADDSLLIFGEGEPAVWQPLRKAFHLSNEALAHWTTRLAGLAAQPRYLDRHSVAALEFFKTQSLAEQTHTQVNGWLFPKITDAPRTRLQPLAHSEALRRLAEQSTYFPLWREHTQRQFEALSRWATKAECYEVLAGQDVLREPEQLSALLKLG